MAQGKLGCLLVPTLDGSAQLLVLGVVELELVASQAAELAEHVSEDSGEEAAVLLRRELAEPIQAVARLDRHQIGEVACLGSSEHREHLVDRQLLAAQEWSGAPGLDREQSRVRAEVELGSILAALDDQAGEAVALLDVAHREAGRLKRAIDRRNELIDCLGGQSEEVEIASLRWTSPRTISAPPPARAKSVASSKLAMISATRSCSGLNTSEVAVTV